MMMTMMMMMMADDDDDDDDDDDKGDDDEEEGGDLATFCHVAFFGPLTRLKLGGRHRESQDEDVPV